MHRSLQFHDIRILIRTWSQHTLCVEWLNGKNLKPSVLVRMCYDRQTMGRAGLSCLRPFVALKSYQRVTLLSKGATFLTSPIPVGLVKMCVVCPGAEFRTQRFSHGRRQAEAQTVPGSRVREVITRIREVTENLTGRGTHWEITLCFVFHCCGLISKN